MGWKRKSPIQQAKTIKQAWRKERDWSLDDVRFGRMDMGTWPAESKVKEEMGARFMVLICNNHVGATRTGRLR